MSALADDAAHANARAWLRQYDVGEVLRIWPVSHGIENQNYFVQTQGLDRTRNFVLTILLGESYAGDAYVPMMRHLDEQGLPVAGPLENRQGERISTDQDGACMLQPRLIGQHTVNPTLRQIESLARFVARMHLASASSDFTLPDYPRNQAWLVAQGASLSAALPYADRQLMADSLRQTASLLGRDDVRALPRGLIHGDLFRDNVLFNEHGLTGVLDFHHAATGYFIYDLAVVANDWCSDASGLLDPDRATRLLRAYHAIRPLSETETWFFSQFAAYAALAFWISRAAKVQSERKAGNQRLKDPDEFKRILQHLHKHYFYLDYRVLSG